MRLFLDTSTLFKLYQKEAGTEEIIGIITNNNISIIFLSEITKIEFDSAVWKNVRSKKLEKEKAIKLINLFRNNAYDSDVDNQPTNSYSDKSIVIEDYKHSIKENRYYVLGKTNAKRKLFIVFTIRNNRIRIISARDMNKKERKIYEKH